MKNYGTSRRELAWDELDDISALECKRDNRLHNFQLSQIDQRTNAGRLTGGSSLKFGTLSSAI